MPLAVRFGPVIEAGELLSDSLDCGGGTLMRLTIPSDWTSANISFQISTDGTDFSDLFDQHGSEIAIPVVPGTAITLTYLGEFLNSFAYFKIRSGTRTWPVRQEARREFASGIQYATLLPPLAPFKLTTVPGTNGSTFDPAVVTGANEVIVMLTGTGAATINLPSAAQIIANMPDWSIGNVYRFRICNPSTGAITLVAGTQVTITGRADAATNTWREYLVRYMADGTVDFRDVGSGNE